MVCGNSMSENKFARKACAAYKDNRLIGKYRSVRDAAHALGIPAKSIVAHMVDGKFYREHYTFIEIPYSEVAVELLDKFHQWKPTYIFPNDYLISDNGQLYSIRANKILQYNIDPDGYCYYVLCVSGERHTVKAHRLVAMAFISNPDNKPALDHINGIRTDNRVDNLRWVTNKENSNNPITLSKLKDNAMINIPKLYASSVKRQFGRNTVAVYKDEQLLGTFESQKLAAKFTNVSEGKVSQCLSGQKLSCKGYVFKKV